MIALTICRAHPAVRMGVAILITVLFGTMASTAAGMLGLGFCAAAIFITRP